MSSSPNSNDLRHPRDPARRDATDVAHDPTPHGPVIFPRVGEVWSLRVKDEPGDEPWLYLAVEETSEDFAFVVLDAREKDGSAAEEAGSVKRFTKEWVRWCGRHGGRGRVGLTWDKIS